MSHALHRSRTSADALLLHLPGLAVSAGTAGARLTIRLLRPAQLTLYGGRWCIVHDPVGLTGDRLLACVYRAVANHGHSGHDDEAGRQASPAAGAAGTLRWVQVRPSMALVCAAADQLATRTWQAVPTVRRVRRVAEAAMRAGERQSAQREWPVPLAPPAAPGTPAPSATLPSPSTRLRASETSTSNPPSQPTASRTQSAPTGGGLPGVLLLSESTLPDAVSHTAAARLILRAVRHGWSVLATTRDAPVAAAPEPTPPPPPTPPWRSHWMCERGVLVPCPPALD